MLSGIVEETFVCGWGQNLQNIAMDLTFQTACLISIVKCYFLFIYWWTLYDPLGNILNVRCKHFVYRSDYVHSFNKQFSSEVIEVVKVRRFHCSEEYCAQTRRKYPCQTLMGSDRLRLLLLISSMRRQCTAAVVDGNSVHCKHLVVRRNCFCI